MPPFVVFALPRSRTKWLSEFLTYKDWHCGHDEARYWRSLDDAKSWLSQPNTGTVETGLAPFWRLLPRYAPEARVVTVRRPVAEVVNSLMNIDPRFERGALTETMTRLDRKLDQIERRLPNVVSVEFDQLSRYEAARIFEFCLPYACEGSRFFEMTTRNIQCDFAAMTRYAQAFAGPMEKLAAQAKQSILAELSLSRFPYDGPLTFSEERFDDWYRDGQALFAEHLVKVGEHPRAFSHKNLALMKAHDDAGSLQIITARSNGRMFGYLMTLISPSWENPTTTWGVNNTFYASPEYPGLGEKLHRAAMKTLVAKGVDEMFDRAGSRGDGPRMGSLFRRHGAELDGAIYRTNLRDA